MATRTLKKGFIKLNSGKVSSTRTNKIIEQQALQLGCKMLTVSFLGRKITFLTLGELLEFIYSACMEKKKIIISSSNVHSFNLSLHLPWFHSFLNDSDIVYCDGFGILKAVNYFFGLRLPSSYRIAGGTELVPSLFNKADELSFFLLGTKPHILEQAVQRLQDDIPGIKVSGHHGYFDKSDSSENDKVIDIINQFKPNILIVGMGMPVQEKWLYENMHRLDTNVLIPCGAVIDRIAGVIPDCPAWLSSVGLEWLYRLIREPKRLANRYLIGNAAFILQVLLAKSINSDSFDSPHT